MSILDVQDELLSGDARYRVRDNAGNITQDNVAIEQITEVTKEGTPINKVLFDDLQSVAIGYNKLDTYEDNIVKNEVDYTASKINAIVYETSTVYSACKIEKTGNILVAYKNSDGYLGITIIDPITGRKGSDRTEASVSITDSIATCNLGNGNILIAFNQYQKLSTYDGKFIIVNVGGATVKTATAFATTDKIKYHNIQTHSLGNGGAIIFYGYTDNDAGFTVSSTSFVTVDENGNASQGSSLPSSGYASSFGATTLRDGRIFATSPSQMYILDAEGKLEKQKSIGITANAPTPNQLNNGNVLIAYSTGSSSPYNPYFRIYDLELNEIVGETSYHSERIVYKPHVITFTNGNACITFYEKTSTAYKFVIYDENGKLVQSAITIGYAYTSIKNVIVLEDDGIFFVGDNGTSLVGYAMGIGTSYYNRNYILPKVGNPLEGQRLKVWNDRELFNQDYGDYAVYQSRLLQFDNDNILLVFRDYTSGNLGAYIVYNQKGNIIKNFTIFNNEVTTIHDLIKLKNGNAMILFTETTIVGSYFMIFDQNMNVVKGKTAIGNDNSGYLLGQTIDNNNVIIVRRPTTTLNLVYSIYSEDGNLVKAETEITSDNPNYMSISETGTANNMGMILYTTTESTSSSPCKYYRYNSSGEIIDGVGQISPGVIKGLKSCKLKNGKTFIAYWKTTNTSNTYATGYFQIWHPAGYCEVAETAFSTINTVKEISLYTLDSGNVCVFYASSAQFGAYVVMSEKGALIKSETKITNDATIQYPYTIQLSNGNSLFCYTESNDGKLKSIPIDDPALISNSINNLNMDTLLNEGFYELVYDGDTYIAKEVRI